MAKKLATDAYRLVASLAPQTPVTLVFAEAKGDRVEGTNSTVRGTRKAVEDWLLECDPFPSKMKFSLVSALGRRFLLSWHDHK